jgi:thiol-disulfide isomerase/thioredoxin
MPESRPRAWRRARRTPRHVSLAAGVAVLALTAVGCSSTGSGTSSGSSTRFVQGTGDISRAAQGHRPQVPDISGGTVDGKTLNLADYRGKVVVVNVWGSWCAPCRAEAPGLEKVYQSTKSEGVEFIGINTRDLAKDNALAFERNFGITYPSLFDPQGKLLLKFPNGTLTLQSIPSTIVVDRKGGIAVRAAAGLTEEKLQAMLAPVIAEKS